MASKSILRELCQRGEFLQTNKAAISSNPLSQAIRINTTNLLFCSGQLGIAPGSNEKVEGGVAEETRQIMDNLKEILIAGGASLNTVIKTTVFITKLSPEEVKHLNDVYESYFSKPYPSRSLVEVAGLNKNCCVEIECIAIVEGD